MKCALLLPGHMRHYKNTFSNQSKTIIDPNECDIFISTSNLITSWIKPHEYVAEEKDVETLEEEIRSVYGDKLKGLIINPEENLDVIPSPLQWKRLKECFKQKTLYEKENNFNYDVILRGRADLVYSRPLKITEERIEDNKVSLIKHFDSRKIPIHDQFAYGHPDSMEQYCNLIDVFISREKGDNRSWAEVGGRSEDQLYNLLKSYDIEIDYMDNFSFKMTRRYKCK